MHSEARQGEAGAARSDAVCNQAALKSLEGEDIDGTQLPRCHKDTRRLLGKARSHSSRRDQRKAAELIGRSGSPVNNFKYCRESRIGFTGTKHNGRATSWAVLRL